MNRFAIAEDDQFEIHVKQYSDRFVISEEDKNNAAVEVMLKAQQGRVISFIPLLNMTHAAPSFPFFSL